MMPIKLNILIVSSALGLAYGLAMYFGLEGHHGLATLAFLGFVPLAMGALPLLFTDVDQIKNYLFVLFIPWLSILSLFVVLLATLKEGGLCIIVLGGPFWILAMLGTLVGVVIRAIMISDRKRKAAGAALMLLPFLVLGLEKRYLVREGQVSVPSTIAV